MQLPLLFCCCCFCVAVFCYGTCSCTLLRPVTCSSGDLGWINRETWAILKLVFITLPDGIVVFFIFCSFVSFLCFSSHQPKAQEAEAELEHTSSFSTSTCLKAPSVLLFLILHQPALLLYSVHKPGMSSALCSKHPHVLCIVPSGL